MANALIPNDMANADEYQLVLENTAAFGQQHLLAFWNELDQARRKTLIDQIGAIDFELIERLFASGSSKVNWLELAKRAQPPQAFRLAESNAQFTADEARAAGVESLRRGEIGAVLVAGGQGTRLGFDHPKGMYAIGPVSQATLFQILLEKIVAVGRRYGVGVPLYLMTSDATHHETQTFLGEHQFFGLHAEDVRLFCQGAMPAVDATTGKILLAEPGNVALSPDGHGGMLAALVRAGCLADIGRRGVRHLFYFQVDNPLVEMCDPLFLGYHLLAKSEVSTLAIAKIDPLERVGNIAQIDDKTQIIEYSDLPAAMAHERNADGSLRFWAGNTAVHMFDVDFLKRACCDELQLPIHIALKKVPYVDSRGTAVEPTEPNAFKFERFIFDLLPAAARSMVMETDPAHTFAPVKNPSGAAKDSPETCRAAMTALHRNWLEAAGAKVNQNVAVEISPLFALDDHELRAQIKSPIVIDRPTYFAGK
jgi:UDP-N-acetylglucosamine/UDP-N-acetylgalactosamine diphosphorylase